MKSCGSLLTPLYRLLSPLGPLLLAGRGGWLSGLWFEGERHCPMSHQAESRPQCIALEWDRARTEVADRPPFVETTLRWLRAYFSGLLPLPPLPDLDLRGTPFQLAVWRELLDVPFATTLSYGDLALPRGPPMAAHFGRRARRGRRRGTQPRFDSCAVSPDCGRARCARGLCRRSGAQGGAVGTRGKVGRRPRRGEQWLVFWRPSAVGTAACRYTDSAAATVHEKADVRSTPRRPDTKNPLAIFRS